MQASIMVIEETHPRVQHLSYVQRCCMLTVWTLPLLRSMTVKMLFAQTRRAVCAANSRGSLPFMPDTSKPADKDDGGDIYGEQLANVCSYAQHIF